MKIFIGVLLALTTLIGAGDILQAQDGLEESLLAYFDAIKSGDHTTALSFYSTDDSFYWVEDGEVKYESKEQVGVALSQLAQYGSMQMEIDNLSYSSIGVEFATMRYEYIATIGDLENGGFSFSGIVTALLKKDSGGWKILQGHTSSTSQETNAN